MSGNVFIWFLCAVAFLKISQKIDSFMGSLGINVGNTGGSMLGEIMLAARGLSVMKNIGKGGASGSGAAGNSQSSGQGTGFASGTFANMVRRNPTNNANISNNPTINQNAGNPALNISETQTNNAFTGNNNGNPADTQSLLSMQQFGGSDSPDVLSQSASTVTPFADVESPVGQEQPPTSPSASVSPQIPSGGNPVSQEQRQLPNAPLMAQVQSGEGLNPAGQRQKSTSHSELPISQVSSGDDINSDDLSQPLPPVSYGFDAGNSTGTLSEPAAVTQMIDGGNSAGVHYSKDNIAQNENMSGLSPDSFMAHMGYAGQPDIPTFSNLQTDGGMITGIETNNANPDGIGFSMYNASQYAVPEGNYRTVEAADKSKWYKQYAAADKSGSVPPKNQGGNVIYDTQTNKKLPSVPQRKDRINHGKQRRK